MTTQEILDALESIRRAMQQRGLHIGDELYDKLLTLILRLEGN